LDICDPFGFGLRQRSRRTPDSRDHPRRRDFFSYHEAYTEAPIVGGNRIEVLLNGDETFPSMLREIRSAQSTITFAQYFYEGPVVKFLQAAFAESWLETTGIVIGGNGYFPRLEPVGNLPAQIVRSSPAGGSFQNYMLFLLSINSAKKSIFITNPYFIPDDVMTEALLKAAGRGVRVVVLAPGKILTYTASRGHLARCSSEVFRFSSTKHPSCTPRQWSSTASGRRLAAPISIIDPLPLTKNSISRSMIAVWLAASKKSFKRI
jgi:phosphatidylserine/phosphatidylglycerophosphate/cardiolipin synthase-like enzyme